MNISNKAKFLILAFAMGFLVGFGAMLIVNILQPPIVYIKEVEKEKIVTNIVEKRILQKYLTRTEINDILNKDKIFFSSYLMTFGSKKDIVKIILNIALKKNVPANLAIALAIVESRLNIWATNNNGAAYGLGIDYGLFQLNSKSFPKVDYYNPEMNSLVAITYLYELFDKCKDWNSAVVFFNCGLKSIWAPTASIKHLALVLEEEKRLDILFNERMMEWKQML